MHINHTTSIPSDDELDAIVERSMIPMLSLLRRPHRRKRWLSITASVAGIAVIFGVGVAVGAAALPSVPGPGPGPGPAAIFPAEQPYVGPMPNFTGPWAAEFNFAYRTTQSKLAHQILAKGSITPADYTTISTAFESCMKSHGFNATVDGPGGQMTVTKVHDKSALDSALNTCGHGFNQVASLYGQISRNPQHLNENQIMAACLVRSKLAPASYTPDDYAADLVSQKFPFNIDSGGALACISNPLGAH
ncbi:MAG: hypothetical protein ABI400_01440 [Lacisediminihabitans sp.]